MTRHPGTFVAGAVFVIIGIAYLFEAFGAWTVAPERLWPVLLIAVGTTVLLTGGRRELASRAPESDDAPTGDDA